jgi:hypothetical protein
MRRMGWNAEHLTGADNYFPALNVGVLHAEEQRALGHLRDLLVKVLVPRNDGALAQHDAGEHGAGADDILARDERVHLLGRNFRPAVVRGIGHTILSAHWSE